MSWNEPGRDHDPWDGDHRPGDVDQMFRRLLGRLRFLGKLTSGVGGGPYRFRYHWWMGIPVLIGIWFLTGFYSVPKNYHAVDMLFGKVVGINRPGYHWTWPWPIAQVRLVNVTEHRVVNQKQMVLSDDGKLVNMRVSLHYRISSPADYLFEVAHPTDYLAMVARRVTQQVGAGFTSKQLQTGDHGAFSAEVLKNLTGVVHRRHLGVALSAVNLAVVTRSGSTTSRATSSLQSGQAGAGALTKAEEKEVRKAEKEAKAITRAASRKAAERILVAKENIARFKSLLPAWKKNPSLVEQLLRSRTEGEILKASPRILVSGPIHAVTLGRLPAAESVGGSVPATTGRAEGKQQP